MLFLITMWSLLYGNKRFPVFVIWKVHKPAIQTGSAIVPPDWYLKHVLLDGPQTAAGDAGKGTGSSGKLCIGAAETLWGIYGAQAEAGVPEHEGHDGQRVRASARNQVSLKLFLKCRAITNAWFFHLLHYRTKESIGRQERLKEEQRQRKKVWSSHHW